ncbi:hypothetical protein KCT17_003647 [Escherichia coli]|nr:hypothetical protein [Escherichia coli]
MNPPMYERVRWVFADNNLTDGYTVQMLFYDEPASESESVMIFRPNGGAAMTNDLGGDHYVLVDVVGARARKRETTSHAQRILDFFQANPLPFGCVGYIKPMGGLPAPVQTEEGRIVYRLPFSCTYGE